MPRIGQVDDRQDGAAHVADPGQFRRVPGTRVSSAGGATSTVPARYGNAPPATRNWTCPPRPLGADRPNRTGGDRHVAVAGDRAVATRPCPARCPGGLPGLRACRGPGCCWPACRFDFRRRNQRVGCRGQPRLLAASVGGLADLWMARRPAPPLRTSAAGWPRSGPASMAAVEVISPGHTLPQCRLPARPP